MEKLTIARVGQEKVIEFTNKKTGKPDSFKKVGVLTNEYGERWFGVSFRGEVPVKVGQSYEFEIKTREYNGKTYYDAELPRQARGVMSDADKTRMTTLENKVTSLTLLVSRLVRELQDKNVISKPIHKVLGTEVEYPEAPPGEAFSTPEEQGFSPDDLPDLR